MFLRTLSPSLCKCLVVFAVDAQAACTHPLLKHQQRNAATILRLEKAWSSAYLTGDTKFEECLLTPDFTAIMSNGTINHLSDELALAQKNKGKALVIPDTPKMTVYMHGNVAVAHYMIASVKIVDGKPHRSYFADYYIWENWASHAYFAQQTSFAI